MFTFLSARRFHGLVAFAAFALLAVAFYMEYQMGLEPCPLCMLQRIVFFCVGVVSLISALTASEKARKVFSWLVVVLSFAGAALAIRHLYLQSLPMDELPACLPGLSYMFEVFPWQEIMQAMVMGTGECGDVVWTLFGISIPGWTLVAFIGMAIINIVIALRANKKISV
ncbi:MAG: disulfide bond formation protein B [Gammaproteobacteria bacterium]|jgi:disulfide bond formation protein DsbB|uniref:Disulfide bond formation protein B n=1 Tax=Marinomonas polaris DSM 16579 TaxID=1122206 RepID=A0A1M4Z0G4_9GAMM|nr:MULTISPECIES: disulfide bond formation protein B [Marinomonas]MBU1296408.1 disulfide bond formation protein B [Gammaproteobacteria bacterium]MBU1464823.1 disulfide bond formation protein B [Gammaproteobacteria bacterium]MBU2021884.1 disulfide bond formation protein B [Gammaproteobacteria bacterium]MBU2237491.1 disulfide bond formation protein B [Gammaproteobacteria bacterium]MBU2318704.1 disulfide bond formation protein B [Gammaproteobacteria bacterium]|tara:strand:- start:19803 stop:20309 length:507 start_codon:yes stop_codon:yes gene_type:complete